MTAPGPSKTEQILTAIETLLAPTYGIKKDNLAKPRIYRGRPEAVARPELPALIIDAVQELSDSNVTNCRIFRTLLLRICIHVQGDAASRAADPIRCSIHSLLFSDQHLGGLTTRLRCSERRAAVDWDDLPGDNSPGVVNLFYEYDFTTLEGDLTQ
jgi:hypothetical protein